MLMKMRSMSLGAFGRGVLYLLLAVGFFSVGTVLAQSTGNDAGLAKIASNVTGSFEALGKLMIAVAYLAGIGFTLGALFKFKQHKDNPTQIPLGTPLAMLVIGIVLIFLPLIIKPAGETIFGTEKAGTAGGFLGGGSSELPGNK